MSTPPLPVIAFKMRDTFYTAKAGDTVYSYRGATYGTVGEEEERISAPCRAITTSPDGVTPPFLVVPQSMLETIGENI